MTTLQKSFSSQSIDELLAEWNDPLGDRNVSEAEDLIHMLQVELAGKEEVIKTLSKDIVFYKKHWRESK